MQIDTLGYDAKNPIYLPQPVNSRHPLNRGRVAWWLTVPGIYGGRQWFDLCGLHHATLTSMTTGEGWRASTRPGGFGAMLFNGTNGHYALISSIASPAAFTMALWVNSSSIATSQVALCVGSSINLHFIELVTSKIRGYDNTNNIDGATTLQSNTWYRVIFTSTGAVGSVYLNGVLDGQLTSAPGAVAADEATIGNYRSGFATFPVIGFLDDVCLWNRALSAVEIKADYDLSRLGYPGVLNRVSINSQGYAQYTPPYFSMVSNPIPIAQR